MLRELKIENRFLKNRLFNHRQTNLLCQSLKIPGIQSLQKFDPNSTELLLLFHFRYTMPLHDHPKMFGFLKCVAGKLKIQSYTKTNHPNSNSDEIYVRQEPEKILDENSEATVLSQTECNYHEITALGNEPAAFFDILSPPYETTTVENGDKNMCSFYKKIINDTTIKLEKISTPNDYFCDSIYYSLENLESESC